METQIRGSKITAVPINYLVVVIPLLGDFSWAGAGTPSSARSGRMPLARGRQPAPFIIAGVGCLLMVWMLAGLMGHLVDVTLRGGIVSASFVWVGLC